MPRRTPALLAITVIAASLATSYVARADSSGSGVALIHGEIPATVAVSLRPGGQGAQVAGNIHYTVTTTTVQRMTTTTVIPAPDLVAGN